MRLTPLTESSDRTLEWSKPNPQRREFQLRDGDIEFARLRWEGSGPTAKGATSDGRWLLNRAGARNPLDVKGALKPRIVVQPAGGGDAYEIAPGFAETVSFGRNSFRWELNANTRTARWLSSDGEPLITISFEPGATEARLQISAGAANEPDLSLLVLTGWYALRNGSG